MSPIKHPSGKIGPTIWDELRAEFGKEQIEGIGIDHANGIMTFTAPDLTPEDPRHRIVGISEADAARAAKVLLAHKP